MPPTTGSATAIVVPADSSFQPTRTVRAELIQGKSVLSFVSKMINDWPVTFDESFVAMSDEDRKDLLNKVEAKYHDFNDIILKTSSQMKDRFQESGKSKLYREGRPYSLQLKHLELTVDRISFRIIVLEMGKGKGNIYALSAGKFFVPR